MSYKPPVQLFEYKNSFISSKICVYWSKVPLTPASGDHCIWITDTCPCALVTGGQSCCACIVGKG
jgi:hypothetical protein